MKKYLFRFFVIVSVYLVWTILNSAWLAENIFDNWLIIRISDSSIEINKSIQIEGYHRNYSPFIRIRRELDGCGIFDEQFTITNISNNKERYKHDRAMCDAIPYLRTSFVMPFGKYNHNVDEIKLVSWKPSEKYMNFSYLEVIPWENILKIFSENKEYQFKIFIQNDKWAKNTVYTNPQVVETKESISIESSIDESENEKHQLQKDIYDWYKKLILTWDSWSLNLAMDQKIWNSNFDKDALDDFFYELTRSFSIPESNKIDRTSLHSSTLNLFLNTDYAEYTHLSSWEWWIQGEWDKKILFWSNMTPIFDREIVQDTIGFDNIALFGPTQKSLPKFNIVNPTKGWHTPMISFMSEWNEEQQVFMIAIWWMPNEKDYQETKELQLIITFEDWKIQLLNIPVNIKKWELIINEKILPWKTNYTINGYELGILLTREQILEEVCPNFSEEIGISCFNKILDLYPDSTIRVWRPLKSQKIEDGYYHGWEKWFITNPYMVFYVNQSPR